MEDKTFHKDEPDSAKSQRCNSCGASLQEKPTFEEMEQTLRELDVAIEQEEALLRRGFLPFRF
jgi:hypothetical protein